MGPAPQFSSDRDVTAITRRVLQLFRQALPDPSDRELFDRSMDEAQSKGMNWVERLEYAAQQRIELCA